jgi:hypothetical protein
MKMIGAYRREAGLVMAIVMSFHLVVGSGFLCANQVPRPAGASRSDRVASAITSAARGSSSEGVVEHSGSRNGTFPCSCKKQKKCPTIPRAAFTANPTHRFHGAQRQFRSVCCDSLASHVRSHSLASKGDPPFLELEWHTSMNSPSPLVIACVLLI